MKKSNKTGAKSLCAAIMAVAMIILSVPALPVSAENGDTNKDDGYRYAVTIEFGSMAFCYDYGKWDVNELRYKANASSVNPAHDTTAGFPGWYGFDGTANRISVKYSNQNEADDQTPNRKLAVTLEYRNNHTSDFKEGETPIYITGVEMVFYSDAALTAPFDRTFIVPHTSPENLGDKTVIYASLKGAPQEHTSDGLKKYISDTFAPIGMLTIRVGAISD
mgnify:CR=1 FL=1